MNAHVKLSPEENLEIARAIFSGASHQEVSQEHGVSIRRVQIAVEIVRRKMARDMKPRPAVPAKVIQLEPKTENRLTVWRPQSEAARELGIVAVREGANPSMPYVSILHGEKG